MKTFASSRRVLILALLLCILLLTLHIQTTIRKEDETQGDFDRLQQNPSVEHLTRDSSNAKSMTNTFDPATTYEVHKIMVHSSTPSPAISPTKREEMVQLDQPYQPFPKNITSMPNYAREVNEAMKRVVVFVGPHKTGST